MDEELETTEVTYRKYIGVSISSLLQEYDTSEPVVNPDPGSTGEPEDESEINPVSEDNLEGSGDGNPDTPSEEEPEGKYGYGIQKNSNISVRDIEHYYGKDEIKSVEFIIPEDELEEEDEEQELSEPVVQNEEDPSDIENNRLPIESVIIKKCPKVIKDKLKGLKIGLVNNKIVLINSGDDINFLDKLYTEKEEDYENAKKEFEEYLNKKFYIGFDLKVTFKVNPENEEDESSEGEDISDDTLHDKPGTYVTLDKNDGSNQRVTRFFKLNDKYQPKIISKLIEEIKDSSDTIKFEERESDFEYDYSVKGYSNEVNDSPDHTYSEFELNHFTMFFGDFAIYTLWDAIQRAHNDVVITIHKNDGTETKEELSFTDYTHSDIDDVDYIKIEDKLSGSMKVRASDQNYIYSYYGLSESADGPVINTTGKKFTESTELYIIWSKEPIIYIEKESDVNPDSYVKHGELQFIEGVLFVQPEDSEIVKKLVYCNGFYYLLCMNNKIYKLLINDTNRIVTKIFDLSGYNSDISKTDIFACDNVLVIKTGKYILTDKETIKSNFGIDDSSLLLKINNTIKKLNTKTIAKIDVK